MQAHPIAHKAWGFGGKRQFKNNNMKNLISTIAIVLILILCAVINAQGQTIKPVKIPYSFKVPKQRELILGEYTYTTITSTITVVSGGVAVKMSRMFVESVVSNMNDELATAAIKQCPGMIRNNYLADYIIAIWRAKK